MSRRFRYFLRKCRGREAPALAVDWHRIAWAFAGGGIGILALAWLGHITATPLLIAPFGATSVLIFGAPESPLAQPRAVVGGHLVATAVALAVHGCVGGVWWGPALAFALGLGAMIATRTTHPPAGADVLLVFAAPREWTFLFFPVGLGAVLLVAIALVVNNLSLRRRYPLWW